MTRKTHGPPPGQPWVWETLELRSSDAWRSAGINVRRFVDFLVIEYLRHGGKRNGKLLAPYRQLVAFGISNRHIPDAIREAEKTGLVDCHRGGMRTATTYALTWLPMHDGAARSNSWQQYRNPDLEPMVPPKTPENLPVKGSADDQKKQKSARQRERSLPVKGSADCPNLPVKGSADCPKSLHVKGSALSIKLYHGKAEGDSAESNAAPGDALASRVTDTSHRQRFHDIEAAATAKAAADPILAEAREIVATFGRAIGEIWDLPTERIPKVGPRGDLALAREWAKAGITAELCLDVFGRMLSRKRDQEADNGPPSVLRYCHDAVQRAKAERGIIAPPEPKLADYLAALKEPAESAPAGEIEDIPPLLDRRGRTAA